MKKITAINLIPVDGIYHPTERISEDMAKMLSSYGRTVSPEPITDEQFETFKGKAIERVSKSLSDYYSSHPKEYERVIENEK